MDIDRQQLRSHLFTVRLWQEELGGGQSEWRGQVQHVITGEAHYFRDWAGLAALLQKMLPDLEPLEPGRAPGRFQSS